MGKLGLSAPAPPSGKIQGLLDTMHTQGRTTGQSFVGSAVAGPKKPVGPSMVATPETISNASVPKKGTVKAIGDAVYNYVKPGLKNLVGIVGTPAKALSSIKDDYNFRQTHGGQDEVSYYSKQHKDKIDEVNRIYAGLNADLASGKMTKEYYDRSLEDLNSWSGFQIDDAYNKMKSANLRATGYQDWQTGDWLDVRTQEWKSQPTAKDIFNIVDGAITLYSIGTAGMGRGSAMKKIEEGLLKSNGGFVVSTLEKIGMKASSSAVSKVMGGVDDALRLTIKKVPGLREYSERQIAKLGGDITARKFFNNALAEVLINSPVRASNMEGSCIIVESIVNDDFLGTKEGKSWLSSGAGQSVLLAGMALEGGPVGFGLKVIGRGGKAVKLALIGDDAVKQISKFAVGQLDDPAVREIIEKYAAQGRSGTAIDQFSALVNNGDQSAIWKALSEMPEAIPAFRSLVATSLKFEGDAYLQAAARYIQGALARGEELSAKNALIRMLDFQKAGEAGLKVEKALQAAGKLKAGQRLAVVRVTASDINGVADDVSKIIKQVAEKAQEVGDVPKGTVLQAQKDAAISYLSEQVGRGVHWAQHDEIVGELVDRINAAERSFSGKSKKGGSIINAIKGFDAVDYADTKIKGVPSALRKEMKDLGYVIAMPKTVRNPFVGIDESATVQIESILVGQPKNGIAKTLGLSRGAPVEELDKLLGADVARVRGASPSFGKVGALLQKYGLGLDDAHTESYRMITTYSANAIDSAEIGANGVKVINQLQDYADTTRNWAGLKNTITDLRQMTVSEISKATGLSREASKKIQQALVQGHIEVPTIVRGLGDKAVDLSYANNPLRRIYSRLQGAGRYTYNPFFKLQETTETKILSYATGFRHLGNKTGKELDAVVEKMESLRMIDGSQLLEATSYGESANQALGKISATLNKFQRRDLAAVVDGMAEKMTAGNVDELLTKHTNDVMDAIRPIVQYPTKGAINSNLARSLNIAIFPARYNLKVTQLAIKALAKEPPMVQAAVVRAIGNFDAWINTDAGLAWQQDYAQEIAAFKWLTPIGSLDWTMKTLLKRHNSWSEVGMIGGLPFGIFTTMLVSQGIIDTNTPYVDPKTGDIFDKRIPASVQGRMATAVMDLLGSSFSYPGRQLMLPGKSSALKNVAFKVTGADAQDFTYRNYTPDDLSPQRRKAQEFWATRAGRDAEPYVPKKPSEIGIPTSFGPEAERLTRYSKSEIANAKKATSSKKGKKAKVTVPFEQIVDNATGLNP